MAERIHYKTEFVWFTAPERPDALFRLLNRLFFDGKLPVPALSFEPLRIPGDRAARVNGEFRPRGGPNQTPAIILDPDSIKATCLSVGGYETVFFHLCCCLLHEMVHYHCWKTGVKEVDRTRQFHNRSYKKEAEAHGLVCQLSPYRSTVHGYNMTILSRSAEDAIRNALPAFHRQYE